MKAAESFTETRYENAILETFRDLGYEQKYGRDVDRDYTNPLYIDELREGLHRVNPGLPDPALTEALARLQDIEAAGLLERNRRFMGYLQDGVTVSYRQEGEERSVLVRLIDYDEIHRNSFIVANQWTVVGESTRRLDVVVFINGLPLVVFELKSPSREETDVSEAYNQLRNYMQEIPSLFCYNAFCVIGDLTACKAGTITAPESRFMAWKSSGSATEDTGVRSGFDVLLEGMFDKKRLLDIVKNFICFSGNDKILAAYHQYFAVRKAIESSLRATRTDGKGGVLWHTQGSGKSLSMVFYTRLLQEALNSPTVVVVTDRNDLDDQLYGQFQKCAGFLRQSPEQARDREDLKRLLDGREANGIFFTTMQKFEETTEPLSLRRNIIVIADEAHRGQYGLEEKVDAKTGKITVGMARHVRDSLPNATYIGFTGTPISRKDRSTVEIFGDYVDIYDMSQAVDDGATVPVSYESRVIHLKLDEDMLRLLDAEYDVLACNAEPYAIEKSKKELGRLETILAAEETIDALCADIVRHYEDAREAYLTGKAMIVAYSRKIAMEIYRTLLRMRPEWAEKVGVVMTESNKDPEDWRKVIGNKAKRKELAVRFKKDGCREDPLKIVIVVDMWLTGFDVPSLATMYVYKPMTGHNLMQAIARVNRVYGDKSGGLVVDYVGVASALRQAMRDYTPRDQNRYGDPDITKTAYPYFIEKVEVCRDLMYGFDYSSFLNKTGSDRGRACIIKAGVDFLSAPGKVKEREAFVKEAQLMCQALTLCRSLAREKERFEAAFFEAVRTTLVRVTSDRLPLSLKDINGRVSGLLEASIHSKGVINLFSDTGTGFCLFDPKFLDEIQNMKERNLAVEILKKLLAEQIAGYRRTNLVKSEKFSEMLTRAMKAYINGMITNEEVIAEMIKMAHSIAQDGEEAESLGLSEEEAAFYSALTKPEAVRDFYENDQLVALTRELTEGLRKSRTIDWRRKNNARAGMRMMVKRLLREYKYPPDSVAGAVETVIRQCEHWADASL